MNVSDDVAHSIFLLLTRDGMGARQVAKRLKLSWASTRRHIKLLLLDERIRPVGGNFAPRGAMQFWEPGPRAGEKWAKVGHRGSTTGATGAAHPVDKARRRPSSGGVGPPKTLEVRLHRGRVSVPIRQAPADLAALGGHYAARPLHLATNHWFKHRDEAGQDWTFQITEPRNRGRGMVLQVAPPAVFTSDPVLVSTAGEPNGWWKKRARKEAHRWADLVGIDLYPDPGEARLTQPIEGGIQVDKGVPKIGKAGVDEVWVDGSPPNGRELESANLDLVVGLMRLPGDVAALRRDFAAMGGLLADQVEAVKELSRLMKGQLAFNTEVVRVQTLQAAQLAQQSQAPPGLPPSSDGYT